MSRDEVTAAYQAAVERKKRDRRNDDRLYSRGERLKAEMQDTELPRNSVFAPEWREAASAAEWWDDRLMERNRSLHWLPETPLLYSLAVALRDGEAAAALAAVKAARQLEPAVQFCVYENLRLWRGHDLASKFSAERAVDRVLAEWDRLKLPTGDPALAEQPARRRRKWDTEAAS
jgi:hypothetical protein